MTSRIALAAAAGALIGFASPAKAADLGGGCCADLEERVAELEATTARKGNRVVSLQVYGFVSRGILFFDTNDDDYDDNDVQLVDDDGSRFGLRGSASLKPGWSAGYRMEFDTTDEQGEAITIRQNNLWVESEQLGRVTIGQQSTATDGIAEITLGNVYLDSSEEYTSATSYSNLDGGRGDAIRYDSPAIYGFILSASWSDDLDGDGNGDYWDVALRYSGEFNAFRVAAGIGYSELEDGDKERLVGSASIMHVPTGLFAAFQAGEEEVGPNTDDFWYVQAGIEKTFLPYGATTIYAEYGEYNDGDDDELYGFGVTQSFDSAALDLYLLYRHVEDESDDKDEFFLLGGKINF